MATEYPIVRLRRAPEVKKRIKGRKPHFPKKIPYERQAERLGAFFDRAAEDALKFEQGIEVSSDPSAVVPERCLVFELIGPVAEFNIAAQALGLDWMRTDEPEAGEAEETDEDEGADLGEEEEYKPKVLYLTMPSAKALTRLLTQWKRFKSGKSAEDKYRELWRIFDYLCDLRVWSVKDRLDPNIAEYVAAVLSDAAQRDVLIEIDLWYRSERERRDQSIEKLTQMLRSVGGKLLDLVDIAEIRYQGALIRVPSNVAQRLAHGEGQIPLLDDIMSIRPQSAYHSHIPMDTTQGKDDSAFDDKPTGPCLAVLLDGYPVDGHRVLDGRLNVRHVDVTAADVPVAGRFHGTAMASLVLHGDLDDTAEPSLTRPLGVIPVLTGDASRPESTPRGKLAIGVIYRALEALVAARSKGDRAFGNVVVVNHSLCDEFHPFTQRLSPWATLLDYFSHQHRLLFVISAGNIFRSFPVPPYLKVQDFQSATPAEREAALVLAVEVAKGTRGLLTPAESINSLTVGAVHNDRAPKAPRAGIDPYPSWPWLLSMVSALGLGANRSVKPDLVEQGGRFLVAPSAVRKGFIEAHGEPSPHVGHLVAAPSATGDLKRVQRTSGTSNAAALVTRSAHFIADALDETFLADRVDWTSLQTRAVLLKALLAHGCSWGPAGEFLDRHYPPKGPRTGPRRRHNITRFLGYGRLNRARVLSGRSNRITLLGDDLIQSGQLHEYRLPIPPSLIGNRELRSITVTLAWTTPVTHRSTDYRGIVLKLCNPEGKSGFWEGVERSAIDQPSAGLSNRGTLVHAVLEGKKLIEAEENDNPGELVFCVQANLTREELTKEQVPYALAVTLEMAQSIRSELYVQVRDAIRAAVRTGVRSRT